MIDCRGDFKVVGRVLKDSWQRKNQGNLHILRNSWLISHGVRKFRTPCKNKLTMRTHFAHSVKFSQSMQKVRTPNTISHAVRKLKGYVNQFHTPNTTLCENQESLCENQKTLYYPFLNP